MRVRGARIIIAVLVLCQIYNVLAIDHLRVAFQWKQIEYDWPSDDTKKLFPDYKQENNLPLGLEVAAGKIFVTVPRWKRGVASSLNYILLNDTRMSPPLKAYPSFSAHQYATSGTPEIVSPFRIRADRCNRLWVMDAGLNDILGSPEQLTPPSLLVFNLTNDQLIFKYQIPEEQRTPDSFIANIAVEDHHSCDDTYAYLGDLGGPGIIVYSWKLQTSWLVKHHYFHPDPLSGAFNVSGISFHWTDGVFGMSLQPNKFDEFSTLYFHPLSSTMEFSVSTKLLRDAARANAPESFHQFQILGTRGQNGQSSVSFLDPKTGILFYALTNLNAIACWRTGTSYTIQKQGRVYMDNVTMVFPNDIKIDAKSNVWVLSDRLPAFMYSHLNDEDYNFRIFTATVQEAVSGTVCAMSDTPMTSEKPRWPPRDDFDDNNRIDGPSHRANTSGSEKFTDSGLLLLSTLMFVLISSALSNK